MADTPEKRVKRVVNEAFVSKLEVLDSINLVMLHCGRVEEGSVKYVLPEGEIEKYGVEERKHVLRVASEMSHIKSDGVNFDHRMAHTYMAQIKNAVKQGIIGTLHALNGLRVKKTRCH